MKGKANAVGFETQNIEKLLDKKKKVFSALLSTNYSCDWYQSKFHFDDAQKLRVLCDVYSFSINISYVNES